MSTLRSGELFAGVGGLGMAVDEVFQSDPAWFAEFDTAPSKVLAHRHPGVPNHGDVTKLTDPEKVEILAGGFPCQDVSLAGRRQGMKNGTRSGLWSEFARVIDTVRPDWVVIENVRGLLSADAAGDVEPCPLCLGDDPGHVLRALGAVLGDLAELGFDAEWTGIRASDVGAPHGRFRIFILAWPSAHTDGDGLAGVGRVGASERDVDGRRGADPVGDGEGPAARVKLFSTPDTVPEAPNTGSNSHKAGNIVGLGNQVMSLLPTPIVSDGTGGPKQIDGAMFSPQMREIAQLLPTPVAQPSGNTPEEQLRKKPGRTVVTDLAVMAENGLIESGGKLLPTPEAKLASSGPDYARMNREGSGGDDLTTSIWREGLHLSPTPNDDVSTLMPTPRATRGGSATETAYAMGGSRSDDERPQGVVVPGTDWGPYGAAIRRWEAVIGRPAPSPVRMDGKGGKARLNPELTEWMMGWPAGHVTDPDVGLTRAEQLKACGNGVVPQQAAAALRELLARPGVPPIRKEAA